MALRKKQAGIAAAGATALALVVSGFVYAAAGDATTTTCPATFTGGASSTTVEISCEVPNPPPVTTTVSETATATVTATVTVTPTPTQTPTTGPTLSEQIDGTWVLQQVSSAAELDRLRPQIDSALAVPGVVGLSVRWPWDAADMTGTQTTNPILDKAEEIADAAGKELSVRFMAGAHTPARVFNAGAAYYLKGTSKVPLPWSNSTGNHQVFVDAYAAYAGKLAAWCRANDVHLLHLSWWGQDWAELNHGAEVRAASGYTYDKWLAGQKLLIDVGAALRGHDLAIELPLSGYGPLSGGQSAALADYIIGKVGAGSDEFYAQANGLGPNGEWGAPDQTVEGQFDQIWPKPVARGVQMIQPQDYDWFAVYGHANAGAGDADATYVEVYLPSFAMANAAQLRQQIAAFAA